MAKELAISYLYGDFQAVVLDGRAELGRWRPQSGERLSEFSELLRQAVTETGFDGELVSLVLADVDLRHVLVNIPQTNQKNSLKILEKEVSRNSEGAQMSWSYAYLGRRDPTAAVKRNADDPTRMEGSECYLLHMMPQADLQYYLDSIQVLGLVPRVIVPSATLLLDTAYRLRSDFGAVGIFVDGPFGGTLILSDLDQNAVFIRHLMTADTGRLAREIQRSLLYANQNMSIRVNTIVVANARLAGEVQGELNFPVRPYDQWSDPYYAAMFGARVRVADTQSLVPEEIRYARRDRIINRVVNGGIVFLALCALGSFGASEWLRYRSAEQFDQHMTHYQLQVREKDRLTREVRSLRDRVEVINNGREQQPLAEWMLGRIGESVPPGMVLTELRLIKEPENRSGKLVVAGYLNSREFAASNESLLAFGRALEAEPWFVQWRGNWADDWQQQYMNGQIGKQDSKLTFELEGRLPW